MEGAQRKRLFILCDGTWQDGVNSNCRLTNVATFARCLDQVSPHDGCLQLVYYDCGVGNGTNRVTEAIDGATGRGISAKIRNAYSFISHNYNFDSVDSDQPDEIILVGFSRGAFAVQCLAAFINDIGLLQSQDLYFLRGLFTLWSNKNFKRWGPGASNPVNAKLQEYVPRMRSDHEEKLLYQVKIKALLVWDTVSALGLPVQVSAIPLSFVGKSVPANVENAFQALALDERRQKFKPRVWISQAPENQRVKQCWFLGTHADIGGNGDAALGAVTLLWMLGQLKDAGIKVGIRNFEVGKHLRQKYLKWDFDINTVFGQLKEKSVLSSTAGHGKPTNPAPYWWLLGMKNRARYLALANRVPNMEIHFSVRLALGRGATSRLLKGSKTEFVDNRVVWTVDGTRIHECELAESEETANRYAEFDEYNWIIAWYRGRFADQLTTRSGFAQEFRGLVLVNGISRGKLDDFVKMLQDNVKFQGGRLAPSIML